MTLEETQNMIARLLGEDEDEEEAKAGKSKIEAPKEQVSPVNQTAIYIQKLMQTTEDSAYDRAKARAEKAYTDMGLNTTDRKKLATYQNVFSDEYNRTLSNGDYESAYYNSILKNKAKEGIQSNAGLGAYAQDVVDTIAYNAGKGASDLEASVNRIYQNATVNLDPNVLYEIASSPESVSDIMEKGSKWYNSLSVADAYNAYNKANNISLLIEAHNNNPNDETIKDLYDIVMNQQYRDTSNEKWNEGRKNLIDTLSSYTNQTERQRRFQTSSAYEHNVGLQQDLQNLETRKQDTYSNWINYPMSGVGVASYMIPSVAGAVLTGGVAEGIGATTALPVTEEVVSKAAQAGALGTMYLSASGNAFTQTLQEGYNWDVANAYAILIGSLETATELIGGETVMAGLAGFSTHTATSKAAQALIAKGGNLGAKLAIALSLDVGAEAVEEMMSAMVEPIINKQLLGKDISATEYWLGVLESARDSVIPTLIMGGYGKVRTINSVKTTQRYLDTKLDIMKMEGSISDEEYKQMKTDLKTWSDDAISGIDEHYVEIENKLEDGKKLGTVSYNKTYRDAMSEINEFTNKRMNGTQEILKYAQQLADVQTLTPQQKQERITSFAKAYDIDEKKLKEIFVNYKDVLPQMYSEMDKIIASTAKYPNAKNPKASLLQKSSEATKAILNKNIQSTKLKKQILAGFNKDVKTKFNKQFENLATKYKKSVTPANVVRLVAELDGASIQNNFNFGEVDKNNPPTYKTLSEAPLVFWSMADSEFANPIDGSKDGKHYAYIYDNLEDFLKDVEKKFGSYSAFMKNTAGGFGMAESLASKGNFHLAIKDGKPYWKSPSDWGKDVEIYNKSESKNPRSVKKETEVKGFGKKESVNVFEGEDEYDLENQGKYHYAEKVGKTHPGYNPPFVTVSGEELAKFKFGEYDEDYKPTQSELFNSPFVVIFTDKDGTYNAVFKEYRDIEKFIINKYTMSLEKFLQDPDNKMEIISFTGTFGKLYYNPIDKTWKINNEGEALSGADISYTEDIKEFFKDVAPQLKKGKLLVEAYHTDKNATSDTPWLEVGPHVYGKEAVAFFTDNPSMSVGYGSSNLGKVTTKGLKVKKGSIGSSYSPVYKCYLNMKHPLVLDAADFGHSWANMTWTIDGKTMHGTTDKCVTSIINYNRKLYYGDDKYRIPLPGEVPGYTGAIGAHISPEKDPIPYEKVLTQDQILSVGGYDGLVVLNVSDWAGGGYGKTKYGSFGTDFITITANQVKLADNMHPTKSKYMDESPKLKKTKTVSKEAQYAAIEKANPMKDNVHTGIRSVNDIKTYSEAMQNESDIILAPDYTMNDALYAESKGTVTVYSSKPITTGTFVTPSKMEAQTYARKR